MAFDPNGLSDVAALNRGRTLFEYGTRDPLATVLAAGYFDAAHGLLTTGDSILVSADDGEAIVRAAIVNGGAVVAVSQGGAGTANLSIPANPLVPGSVARSVEDKLRERRSVKDFGVLGDGSTYDNVAFQTAVDRAATDGFDLYVPPTAYFYRFGSPVYLRSGVRVFGSGQQSYIYNDRSSPSTYGDHFVFMFGNYAAGSFGSETWKTVSSCSEADSTITLSTAADASGFAVGTVVMLRGGSTWGSPAIYQYQQINEVLAANGSTGVVTLMYPPPAGMTTGGLAKSGGSVLDSLGNACALVKDISLENLRIRAGYERWSGYGGALRPVFRNLHIESDALFSHNALAFGQIDNIRGRFTSKGLEFARFCNDMTVSRVTGVSDGRTTTAAYLAPLQISEQAHGILADGVNLKAYAPWAARSAVSIIAACRCRISNSDFLITGASSSALDISAEATNQVADDNTYINVGVRAIGARNFDLRIQQSGGGSANRNGVFGCRFVGTTPAVGAYRLAATDSFIANNHFPTHGTGQVTSAGVREMIGRNNHGSNTFTLSDSGTGTIGP